MSRIHTQNVCRLCTSRLGLFVDKPSTHWMDLERLTGALRLYSGLEILFIMKILRDLSIL